MTSDFAGRRVPGQITAIAWMYIVFGLIGFIVCITGARVGAFRFSIFDLWWPILLIIAAVGAILRKPWGRWGCYVFSLLILPGIPLGTIMGGFMIYYLTVYRDQFRPRSSIPNPNAR